ncbi:Neuroguidin-A, partial [Stegodyphus mimosarum]
MEDISSEDVEETIQLIKEVPQLAGNVSDTVQNVLKRMKNNELETHKGISFLDLKNQIMLSYVTNLTFIVMKKLQGKKIEDDPVVERLIELRIVLEKMRPIDEKLKYQINKLLATAISGNIDTKDPLRFRANPESLDDQEEEDTPNESRKESKVYVPPKISAAYFEEDTSIEARKKKILERSQKRALSSSVLYELRKEYDTGPEEIKEMIDPYKIKLNEEMKERTRYEEEYMLRLPMTKKQRHEARQLTTVSNFNTKFDDISALEMTPDDVILKKKTGTKKGKFAKYKGKKKGFKRKRH